jgi:hypothetical protein
MYKILALLAFILAFGCVNSTKRSIDPPIARVYEKQLHASGLKEIVPKEVSAQDSQIVAKEHIDKWIRNQLLLFQAEQQLSIEDKDVEQQIEDYRTSLLIYKYEQNYLRQKLDTNIADSDIEKYYNNYSSNFILNTNLVKGIFIQVPRTAPEIYKVRAWYSSTNPNSIKDLEQYCYNHATKYNYFEEQWEFFSTLLKDMPLTYTAPENMLRYRKYFETKDSTFYYFMKISDYRLEGAVSPLEFVRRDIKDILLNKRKIQLIQELESAIYNDALNRGNFEIY